MLIKRLFNLLQVNQLKSHLDSSSASEAAQSDSDADSKLQRAWRDAKANNLARQLLNQQSAAAEAAEQSARRLHAAQEQVEQLRTQVGLPDLSAQSVCCSSCVTSSKDQVE